MTGPIGMTEPVPTPQFEHDRDASRMTGEEGRILILGLGYLVVVAALILTVVVITGVHLDRNRALGLVDGAADAAAGSLDEDAYYEHGVAGTLGEVPPLTDESVREAAEDYLATAPVPAGITSVHITDPTGVTSDGDAQVTLAVTIEPTALPAFVGQAAQLTITVAAVASPFAMP